MTTQVPNNMIAFDGGSFSLRNKLINGDFRVAQRSTTYALTNGWAYGSVDRWAFLQGGTASGIANQVASGLTGFQYAIKVGRNSGSALTNAVQALQVLETTNSIPLAGQTVTLSFYAKAGANFSGVNLGVTVGSGTGTDQASSSWGVWTGFAYSINTSQALTTSWVRYSFTGTIPANATQVGVDFYYTPVGTAGADDNFYITGVQLEVGSTATPFEYRPYGTELALCQRYYLRNKVEQGSTSTFMIGAVGSGTTVPRCTMAFPVAMRSSPTASQNSTRIYDGGAVSNVTSITNQYSSTTIGCIDITCAGGGLTQGRAGLLIENGATGYVDFSSEL